MNAALVSSADPMKANTGNAALYDEEPGCCARVCKWCMITTTVSLVVVIMVLGVLYMNCHDLPLVGLKDGCKTHPHAHTGSSSDGELFDGDEYTFDGMRRLQQPYDEPW